MTAAALGLAAAVAAGFPVLLWALSRAVTAVASRVPPASGPSRQYLAGRLDDTRIASLVAYDEELLVSLSSNAHGDALTGVFRITASACSLARVKRWRDEGTPLRAYFSTDGAVMLADPVLGGNAACEPPATVPGQVRELEVSPDRPAAEDK